MVAPDPSSGSASSHRARLVRAGAVLSAASAFAAFGCELVAGIDERSLDLGGAGGTTSTGVGGGTPTGSGGEGGQSCPDAPPECQPSLAGAELDSWPDSSPYCVPDLAACQPDEDGARVGPRSYMDLGNGTISDGTTGLVWQQESSPTGLLQSAAETYCNQLPLGAGPGTWRLPSFCEMLSLVDHGSPTLLPELFSVSWVGGDPGLWVRESGGPDWHYYFMFAPALVGGSAQFHGGEATWGGGPLLLDGPAMFARCVSGDALAVSPSFEHCCEPGLVRDSTTGLVWQAAPSTEKHEWSAARSYCSTLPDHDGHWRLASVKELSTIFKPDGLRNVVPPLPPLDPNDGAVFWTSTPSIARTDRAMVVDFVPETAFNFPIRAEYPTSTFRAWCVRSYEPEAL